MTDQGSDELPGAEPAEDADALTLARYAERAYLDSLHWVSETLGAIDAGSVFS